MKIINVEPILNHPLFHTWKKKDLVDALKKAEPVDTGCFCEECALWNSTACPAYDEPMGRTSLRIHGCTEGSARHQRLGKLTPLTYGFFTVIKKEQRAPIDWWPAVRCYLASRML